jgi:DNA primase
VITLAVEPVLREPTPGYAAEYAAGVRLLSTARQIDALKSRLQRTNPVEDQPAYNRMFATLVELESRRKTLLALATGPAL